MVLKREVIEGRVDKRCLEDGIEVIHATLISSTGRSYPAMIDVDRFPESDQPLLEPGVSFTIREPGPELRAHPGRPRKSGAKIVRGDE